MTAPGVGGLAANAATCTGDHRGRTASARDGARRRLTIWRGGSRDGRLRRTRPRPSVAIGLVLRALVTEALTGRNERVVGAHAPSAPGAARPDELTWERSWARDADSRVMPRVTLAPR